MTTARRSLFALLLTFAVVVVACGRDTIETSEAPGFSDQERSVDRAPFELAVPNGEGGPTTSPGQPTLPLPDDIEAKVRPGSLTTTTRPPTTTTTTTSPLPSSIVIPGPTTIFNLCGYSYSLTSLRLVPTTPSVDLPQLSSDLRAALSRYEVVAPPAQRDAVQLVNSQVEVILSALAAAGYDVNAPTVAELIDKASRSVSPFEGFALAAAAVKQHEESECPGR